MESHQEQSYEALKASKLKNASQGQDLCNFFNAIDKYKPSVPEAVTQYYLEKVGVSPQDQRILSMVCLATDKFLAEIIYEAKEQSILRKMNPNNPKRKNDSNDSIDILDLEASLAQSNIFFRRSSKKVKHNE